jgi:hypothetical protein
MFGRQGRAHIAFYLITVLAGIKMRDAQNMCWLSSAAQYPCCRLRWTESRLPARLPHRITPHDPSGCACTTHGKLKRSSRRFVTSPHLNNLRFGQIICCGSSAEVPEKQADFVLVTAHTFVLWLIPPRLSGSLTSLSLATNTASGKKAIRFHVHEFKIGCSLAKQPYKTEICSNARRYRVRRGKNGQES